MIKKQSIFFSFFLLSFLFGSAQLIEPTEVKNVDVNSQYAEFGVKFIQDNVVLYASSKKNETTGKREKRNNRHLGLRLFTGAITEDGSIINPKLFQPAENNPIFESNITFTSDLKSVYFTRNNYIMDNYRTFFKRIAMINKQILKIFRASIDESGELSNITPLPFNSDNYSVTNPHLSLDGKKLYFSSDMKGTYGGFDIYVVDIQSDGTFSEPKNLGDRINSKGDEFFPFVDLNNFLYFSSDGHDGLGELDVFMSSLSNESQKPINLGTPINSEGDDFSLVFNAKLNIGYFSSTRVGGFGNADIYSFIGGTSINAKNDKILVSESSEINNLNSTVNSENNTSIELQNSNNTDSSASEEKSNGKSASTSIAAFNKLKNSEECTQIVEGFILNSKNTTLDNASVTLYENGINVGTYKISPNGKYKFELKCKYHYRVTARLNNFEENYFEIRTNQLDDSKTITNITLDRIPCDVLLTGELRDRKTKLPIANAKVYLIYKESQIKATATNSAGKYSFKVDCGEDYKINTDKYGYKEGLFEIKTGSKHNSIVSLNSVINPNKCSQIINGKVTDLITGNEIIGATIELINSKGMQVESVGANTNGNFHFNIDCKEKYIIRVSNNNYVTATSEFKTNDIDRQIQRLDFALTSNICKQTITGTVVNSKSNELIANASISLLKDDKVLYSMETDQNGSFNFDVDCNENYEIAARKNNFSPEFKYVVTNRINNNRNDLILSLESKLNFEIVRNQKMILTNDIDFELNKSEIREDAAIELNKIIRVMNQDKNIKVAIGVHTDSRAPDDYNLSLSTERAQSILAFIISKGISAERLSGEGFGETKLLNQCSNGVRCSETEHLENRRIEFIVSE